MEKQLNVKTVFNCPIFHVEEAEVELPDGNVEKRWYVVNRNAVGIVPISDEGRIMVVREYLSANESVCWGIPSGKLETNEDPQEGAQRELREEIGFDAHSWELFLSRKATSNWQKRIDHFFIAKDLFWAPLENEQFEYIELIPLWPNEVLEKINQGEFSAPHAVALLKAINMLEQPANKQPAEVAKIS